MNLCEDDGLPTTDIKSCRDWVALSGLLPLRCVLMELILYSMRQMGRSQQNQWMTMSHGK